MRNLGRDWKRAWVLSLMLCGAAFGCSSGSSSGQGTGGQSGKLGQPGCTRNPDCSACGDCYSRCYCYTSSAKCAGDCGLGTGGTGATGAGGTGTGGSGAGGSGTGGSGTGGSGTGGSSGSGTGGSSGSGTGGSSGSGTGGSGTGGTTSDPFAAARQKCIDHINALRKTKGRAPYTRWTSIESCVDGEATYDSTHGPHADFIAGNTCGAYSQGECPGQGPSSVTQCIDLMWAEKDQAICSGCDSCPSMQQCFAGNCPNCQCTTSNPTCGHYVALVVASQSMAACGFSTGSPYMTIDYK